MESQGRFTIDATSYNLNAGQLIVMLADIPHAVDADQPLKILLTVVKKGA